MDFDDEFAGPSQWAEMYRALGFQAVPAESHTSGEQQWKRPVIKWRQYTGGLVDDQTFASWYGPQGEHVRRLNVGIITGAASGGLFVIDLDTHKGPAALNWWHGLLALENNGIEPETAVQTTGGGGKQYLFRAPPGWTPPTNKTSLGIDIRGQGGFIMAPPSMHESGTPYRWDEGREPWNVGVEDAPQWLCEAVDRLVREHGGGSPAGPSERLPGPSGVSGLHHDAFGFVDDGREEYATKLVWAALVGQWRESPIKPSEEECNALMRAQWAAYERNVKSRIREPGTPKHILLEREGRGITMFADKWKRAVEQWDTRVREAGLKEAPKRPQPPKEAETPATSKEPSGESWDEEEAPATASQDSQHLAIDIGPWSEKDEPHRDWIVPGYIMRGAVSLVSGHGASGKSTLMVAWTIALAMQRTLGDFKPTKRMKVINYNTEDNIGEQRRRYSAAFRAQGVRITDVADRIIRIGPKQIGTLFERDPKTGRIAPTPALDQMIEIAMEHEVDVILVDPLVELHNADENDNTAMRSVIAAFRAIAVVNRIGVVILHHDRKGSHDPGNPDRIRGASAISGAVRVMLTVTRMSVEEADEAGVDDKERTKHFRVDNAKSNYSGNHEPAWWKIDTYQNPNGEIVAACLPWKAPSAWDDFSMDKVVECLETIDRGMNDGSFYSAGKGKGTERWAGEVLIQTYNKPEKHAKTIIDSWMESGVLIPSTFKDAKYRSKDCVRVDIDKLNEMKNQVPRSPPET